MRKRLTIAVVAVVGAGAPRRSGARGRSGGGATGTRTTFEQAAAYAPADAQRLSWTDWAAVREHAGAGLDADSSADDVQAFLDDAFDDDLTSASALVQSAPVLQAHFGFSPATVDVGAVQPVRRGRGGHPASCPTAPTSTPSATTSRTPASPGRAPTTGSGSAATRCCPRSAPTSRPSCQYVALDADRGLVLTSDRQDYLQQVVDGLGDAELPGPMRSVVDGSGEPLSAAVYDGDNACSTLAMSQADADDQATADRLVDEAGTVDPVTAYAMSVQPGGTSGP